MKNKEVFKLINVTKTFSDGTIAINNVSTIIYEGITVIIGPSGSGKSTLLRTLNLIEKPTQGEILYKNENILNKDYNINEHRRKVGMVFQNFHLFPHLTILENLNIAQIEVLNKSKEAATIQSLTYLKRVGLKDKANNYPNQLSGGQKQRIAIARSLCMNPEVILFDEPTSALDPEMIKEVLEVMKELANEGMNMVIVTHEMDFAYKFADEIFVVDNGEIIERNTPKNIFTKPENIRTKQFLENVSYKMI